MDWSFPLPAKCCPRGIVEGMLEENPENLCDVDSLNLRILLLEIGLRNDSLTLVGIGGFVFDLSIAL